MWNLNDVTDIQYLSGYSYRIVFDDQTQADVNFTEFLDAGPMFAPLREVGFFKSTRSRAVRSPGRTAWTLPLRPCTKSAGRRRNPSIK